MRLSSAKSCPALLPATIDMEHNLFIYNSLARVKQPFRPIHDGHVGMYVCGPTVYGDAHLGHARPAITFDILFRRGVHQIAFAVEAGVDAAVYAVEAVFEPEGEDVVEEIVAIAVLPELEVAFGVSCPHFFKVG